MRLLLALVALAAAPLAPEPVPAPELPTAAPAAPKPCGPVEGATHCVVFPPRGAPEPLVQELARLGLEASVEGSYVLATMDDAAIARLLGGPPVYRRVAKSSGDGFVCAAALERPLLPKPLAKLSRAPSIGHQLCE